MRAMSVYLMVRHLGRFFKGLLDFFHSESMVEMQRKTARKHPEKPKTRSVQSTKHVQALSFHRRG